MATLVPRPMTARAVVERTAHDFRIHVPAEGLSRETLKSIGFTTLWTGGVAIFTAIILAAHGWKALILIPFWFGAYRLLTRTAWELWGTKSIRMDRDGLVTTQRCMGWSRSSGPCPRAVAHRAKTFVLPEVSDGEGRWLVAEINDFVRSLPGGGHEGTAFLVEVEGVPEVSLPDAPSVCELLGKLEATDTAQIWIWIDHGPVRLSWLDRRFGASDREQELCLVLGKVGDLATLTFDDGSEWPATDPTHPTEATVEQRVALSFGDRMPVPPETCLQTERAFRAAVEYLRHSERPDWLSYLVAP